MTFAINGNSFGGVEPGWTVWVPKRAAPETQDLDSWLNLNSVGAVIFDYNAILYRLGDADLPVVPKGHL